MPSPKQLRDLYRFPGCVPLAGLQVFARDAQAVLLTLRRRQKKRYAAYVGRRSFIGMTTGLAMCATWPVAIGASTWPSRCAGSIVGAWRREDRTPRLAGQQPVLYEAVRLLCRP